MPIPIEAQNKMIRYNFILAPRYAPSIIFYQLSNGYKQSEEAEADLVPVYVVYEQNNDSPINISSVITIDQTKLIDLDGENLWYHVFDSSSNDEGYIISIGSKGIVTNKLTTK